MADACVVPDSAPTNDPLYFMERIQSRFVLSRTSLSHTYVGISFFLMVLTKSSISTGFVK